MPAWFALLARATARSFEVLSEILGPAPRLAPARPRLPRKVLPRAPRRRTIAL